MTTSTSLLISLPGLPIPQLVQCSVSKVATSYSLPGLPIPQLVQYEVKDIDEVDSLPGLPIPQLVQSKDEEIRPSGESSRPSNSPVGTI